MQTAQDILKGIYAEAKKRGTIIGDPLTKQKLLYYCQAWSLVWTGRPLYADAIQAWDNGPVTPSARGLLDIADSVDLPQDTQAIIKAVLDHYGHLSGKELSERTHQEEPWKQAYEKGRNATLDLELMRRYYSSITAPGECPTKPALSPFCPSSEQILESGRQMAARWRETLELLGQ